MKLVSSMRELTSQEIDMVAGGHDVMVCMIEIDSESGAFSISCQPVPHEHPPAPNPTPAPTPKTFR
jgi:hypothetical protein